VVGKEFGVGLKPDAGLEDWIYAIERIHQKSLMDSFQQSLQSFLSHQPDWRQAAKKLRSAYDGLF